MEYNPNPELRHVGDCAVRAISKAFDVDWERAYAILCAKGFAMKDLPNADSVWSAVLKQHGFTRHIIPNSCPNCYTAEMFCRDHPQGVYVLGFGNHVVTVVDGNIYDSWDSSSQVPIYYWKRR